MGVSLFGNAALNDIIERRQEATIATLRYEAKGLDGFITPRWNPRKRMEVSLIDFNCQRRLKTDPLFGNIAGLKLTHPWRLVIG